jgi:hypothetical protein
MLLQRHREARFEQAVGQQDGSMRLALALKRDLARLATKPVSEEARWFTILGTPSLRAVFETAFRLPREFAALDLDRQVDVLKARVERLTGSADVAQFADPSRIDRLLTLFFVGTQLSEQRQAGPASVALRLLEGASQPSLGRRPG